ncbi:MAG: hypothetical protein IPH45_05685 [Bacteroidales bacterium]|nr:hypothetical protein [Bacteroidales bacterium]
MSCKKTEVHEAEIPTSRDFDSLKVRAYVSTYIYNLEGSDYLAFIPSDSTASVSIDIDNQTGTDFKISCFSNVFSLSPHSFFQQYGVNITATDTSVFSVAAVKAEEWASIKLFEEGTPINNDSYFVHNSAIDYQHTGGTLLHRGNIYLGIRKKNASGDFYYGFLNLYVGMAQVTILKSMMRNDNQVCIIE